MTVTDPRALVPSDSAAETFHGAAIAGRARSVFESGATRSIRARRRLLKALRAMLVDHSSEWEQALANDLHKSVAEARTTEIDAVVGEINHSLRSLRRWLRLRRTWVPMVLQPAWAHLAPEPLGTVLVVSPWNYPVQLMLNPLVGVLAAGNTAVLKPSSQVPAVAEVVARLVPLYFPCGEVQVVTGPTSRTTALLEQRWDHIVFTGSGRIGRTVMAAAAKHLTPVTLELGGKSPVWIDDDQHIADAARRLAWAKFTNAGQTCVAPDYVMTTPERVPALVEALRVAIEDLYGSDPRESEDFGRIINEGQVDRLVGYLNNGEVLIGGQHVRSEKYVAPTVVVLPQPNGGPVIGPDSPHPVLREEIFGPVLPIVPVPSAMAAVDIINSWDKPLALYVFSSSRSTRRLFERRTSSGAVVNDAALIHVGAGTLPFGGVGASGMGQYHGEASIRGFSHFKPVLTKPLQPDSLRMAQPGADRRVLAVVRCIQRLG